MPTKKTTSLKKNKPASKKAARFSRWQKVVEKVIRRPYRAARARVGGLLSRRPHRSFRRTRRRDYARTLKLPGYWAFTNYVRKTLWQHKALFVWLVIIYGGLTILLVGMASQASYEQISEILRKTSDDVFSGNWGAIGQAGLLLMTGVTGSMGMEMTDVQQMYAVIIGLFTWLTVVWLLRAVLAGHKPKLRDGLYNAGSPILPMFFVALFAVIQLIPVAIAALGFTSLLSFGILEGGVEAMLFWTTAALLIGLSLYWLTNTVIALVVVTLPGMYPLQAIRTAGDLVIGRRVRILMRLLWLVLVVALIWLAVMVPLILLDTWIKGVFPIITWLPTIPVALLVMGTLTVIWMASYVYLLYRRIVDDDAAPA